MATGSIEQSEATGGISMGEAARTVAVIRAERMGAGERRWDGSTGRRSTRLLLTPSSETNGMGEGRDDRWAPPVSESGEERRGGLGRLWR